MIEIKKTSMADLFAVVSIYFLLTFLKRRRIARRQPENSG